MLLLAIGVLGTSVAIVPNAFGADYNVRVNTAVTEGITPSVLTGITGDPISKYQYPSFIGERERFNWGTMLGKIGSAGVRLNDTNSFNAHDQMTEPDTAQENPWYVYDEYHCDKNGCPADGPESSCLPSEYQYTRWSTWDPSQWTRPVFSHAYDEYLSSKIALHLNSMDLIIPLIEEDQHWKFSDVDTTNDTKIVLTRRSCRALRANGIPFMLRIGQDPNSGPTYIEKHSDPSIGYKPYAHAELHWAKAVVTGDYDRNGYTDDHDGDGKGNGIGWPGTPVPVDKDDEAMKCGSPEWVVIGNEYDGVRFTGPNSGLTTSRALQARANEIGAVYAAVQAKFAGDSVFSGSKIGGMSFASSSWRCRVLGMCDRPHAAIGNYVLETLAPADVDFVAFHLYNSNYCTADKVANHDCSIEDTPSGYEETQLSGLIDYLEKTQDEVDAWDTDGRNPPLYITEFHVGEGGSASAGPSEDGAYIGALAALTSWREWNYDGMFYYSMNLGDGTWEGGDRLKAGPGNGNWDLYDPNTTTWECGYASSEERFDNDLDGIYATDYWIKINYPAFVMALLTDLEGRPHYLTEVKKHGPSDYVNIKVAAQRNYPVTALSGLDSFGRHAAVVTNYGESSQIVKLLFTGLSASTSYRVATTTISGMDIDKGCAVQANQDTNLGADSGYYPDPTALDELFDDIMVTTTKRVTSSASGVLHLNVKVGSREVFRVAVF
jgi:hypothetical protein